MDIRKLKTILDLFENSSLTEIEFCEGEERIRLSKSGNVATMAQAHSTPPPSPPPNITTVAPITENIQEEQKTGTVVKSPMVGTFYRSPSPEKEAFVSIGAKVEKGDTLGIVEAMKLMNEIPSPVSGTIKEIFAHNGEPVGFGAQLFIIE